MKHGLMILTLCATLLGSAHAMTFTDVTRHDFQGTEFSVVAWGDVDANGYPDLFLGAGSIGESRLFLNNGITWTDASEIYEVASISNVKTARFIDYDQDGSLDLFCLTGDEEGAELYRQSASHRFQRINLNLDGVTDDGIRSAIWCDADYDGQLDLLLSNRSTVDDAGVLLEPTLNGFVEVRGANGPYSDTQVNIISSIDFDQDGDIDYFMSKTDGSTSLWVCDQGVFHNYGPEMNLPNRIADSGITWADFNRDGNLDFFACGSEDNNCLFYQCDTEDNLQRGFQNMTDDFELRYITKDATSAYAVDPNCDGYTDIFLVREVGNMLLVNNGGQGWTPVDIESELRPSSHGTRVCAWADMDNDGDLDVVMTQGRNGIKLYRNDTEATHEFIGLKLCGTGDVMTPVANCLVTVNYPDGKQWAATSMYAGTVGNELTSTILYNPTDEHSLELTVYVLWPNGATTTLTQNDVNVNEYKKLHMPFAPSWNNNELAIAPQTTPDIVNYPNPFNPTTNIEFTLSEATNITLSIYNLLGQEVETLASGTYEAGLHSLAFDAAALPSGLYLAHLETPAGSVVHRMLLTK